MTTYYNYLDIGMLRIYNIYNMDQSDIIKKKLIKEFEKKSSPTLYEVFRKKIIQLLRYICICLRYPLIYIQEFLINLETKINKML